MKLSQIMPKIAGVLVCSALSLGVLAGCLGTTGGSLVSFHAALVSTAPADASGVLRFRNQAGFDIELTRARVFVGGLYLSNAVPLTNDRNTSCFLNGVYVGEVRQGQMFDALSAVPQPFPGLGEGLLDTAVTGEVWLGNPMQISDDRDDTTVLEATGTATKAGVAYPFHARIHISTNRVKVSSSAAQPGANPMCLQRIVSPIQTRVMPHDGGTLTVGVNPTAWFRTVQFDQLTAGQDGTYEFADASTGQPNIALYDGLRANVGAYSFGFGE